MSRKSTVNNPSETFIQSQAKGWTPEFEKILMSHGFVKQNDTDINKININVQPSVSPIKVKAPILDDEYLDNPKEPHMPVQPIRIKDDIEKAKAYFHNTPSRYSKLNLRNFTFFILGINVACRAGDLLKLRIRDFINPDGTFKEHIIIIEEKTKKKAIKYLNVNVQQAIAEYLQTKEEYCMSELLFQNYKTGNMLTVDGARKIMKRMNKKLSVASNLGTHSLRKTWAYQASINNPNDSCAEIKISRGLNHANVETSSVYMEKSQDEMDQFFKNNAL